MSDRRASFGRSLAALLGPDRVREQAPLAPLTTFHVGGAAEWLVELRGAEEIVRTLATASAADVPVTLLGGGSNVLISDTGVAGLVIRVHGGEIRLVGKGLVRADAGVTVNGLVRWTISRGLGGLETWAGTPGTVGGGVHGNAHFRGKLLSEQMEGAAVAARDGEIQELPAAHMEFAYDRSRLQRTGETLLWADFRVEAGDPVRLRETARASLAYRKTTQPLGSASAGCIFQNPDASRENVPPGVPASAGALIERAGLKGRAVGNARVSPTHANFIVNGGGASAREVRLLIALCKRIVKERFGVELREEIVYLGDFGEAP